MPHITVHNEKIHYLSNGRNSSVSLLAIHGAGGDHRHWPPELHRITAIGSIVVDLPGHGLSGGSGRQTVDAYADFVESLVDALELESVIAVGHSMGGAIVQTLGLRRSPWLRKMVLVGTGARLRVIDEILQLVETDYPTAVDLICGRAFGPSISDAARRQYRENLMRTSPQVTRDDFRACNRFDVMDKVSALRVPTLIISGSEDSLTPPKYGNYLQDCIRGSVHTILSGAGHMAALEKPEAFIKALSAFST